MMNRNLGSEIVDAIYSNDTRAIEYLIKRGYDICSRNNDALKLAINGNKDEMVVFLIEKGADIHFNDDYAIRKSTTAGKYDLVKALIEHGVNIHIDDEAPLITSIFNKRFDIAELLLEHGADIHGNDNECFKKLQNKFDEEIASQLLLHCREADYTFFPADYIAAHLGTKSARTVTDAKTATDAKTPTDATELTTGDEMQQENINMELVQAASEGDTVGVLAALKAGALIHYREDYALAMAVMENKPETITLLLDNGANIHAADDHALRHAVVRGNYPLVNMLIERGADIHIDYDEPLRASIFTKRFDIARLLLEKGANLRANDNDIFRTLRYKFDEEIALMLLPYCSTSDYDYFPPHFIVQHGHANAHVCPCTSATLISAINFAAIAHVNQRRKNALQAPYINHPIEVMMICSQAGLSDNYNILCGAVLHDVLEDTATSYDDLCAEFGLTIADIVRECTDDKTIPKAARKRAQVEKIRGASYAAKIIKGADKISNISDLITDPPIGWSAEQVDGYFVWSYACWQAISGTNSYIDGRFEAAFTQKGIYPLSDEELNVRVEKYYASI